MGQSPPLSPVDTPPPVRLCNMENEVSSELCVTEDLRNSSPGRNSAQSQLISAKYPSATGLEPVPTYTSLRSLHAKKSTQFSGMQHDSDAIYRFAFAGEGLGLGAESYGPSLPWRVGLLLLNEEKHKGILGLDQC